VWNLVVFKLLGWNKLNLLDHLVFSQEGYQPMKLVSFVSSLGALDQF
jgi:hypothetical protein